MTAITAIVNTLLTDKLGIAPADIDPSKSFGKDYGIDSLDLFEFIIEIEKTFDLTIADEQAEKITTIGQLIDYLGEHAPQYEHQQTS